MPVTVCDACGLHAFENTAYDAADYPAFYGLFSAGTGHVFEKLVGQTRNGERLEPDAAGAGEGSEKDTVAAKDHVAQTRDALDLEGDGGLKGSDVAGMDAEGFAGCEVFDDHLAGEFEPGEALAGDLLEEKAVATEDTGAKGLLEAYAKLDADGSAEKAVAVDEVLLRGRWGCCRRGRAQCGRVHGWRRRARRERRRPGTRS